jgi:hypothetical protein
MLLCVLVCFVSACGQKAPTDGLSALRGLYRSAGGSGFIFNNDGTFDTTERVSGRYTVEGRHVVLTIADRSLTAERVSNDELLLPAQQGRAEEHWYRVGSAAADAARTSEAPTRKVSAAPVAAAPQTPPVDRSVPLDRYVSLDPTDPLAARFLLAAFGGASLNDDQKLSLLSSAGARTSDVFARRELAAKELPTIEARLSSTRAHPYVRIEAAEPIYLQRVPKAARALAVWNPPVSSVGHYDMDRKGFGVPCAEDSGLSFRDVSVSFHRTMAISGQSCLLRVSDEATARALEAEVSKVGGILPMSATLYFVIQGPAARLGQQVLMATPTHLTLRIYHADLRPDAADPVATFDIDVPQAPLPAPVGRP